MQTYLKDLERENEKLKAILRLLVEEMDDPCRRNQQEYGPVWISQPLEKMAREAID